MSRPGSRTAAERPKRRKALHIDVVLEGAVAPSQPGCDRIKEQQANSMSPSLGQFLRCLGQVVPPLHTSPFYNAQDASSNSPAASPSRPKPDSTNNGQALGIRFRELVETERTYLRRIKVLFEDYACYLEALTSDPSSRSLKLTKYDFKQLFGNIKAIYKANQDFFADLEHSQTPDGPLWGEVMVKHLTIFTSLYVPYLTGIEKSRETEAMLAQDVVFSNCVAKIKLRTQTSGIGNVGLKELLMEPVQRIPRYKMILDGLLRYMSEEDPNFEFVQQAMAIASRIANCESDEQVRRAATMWALKQAVQDFPDTLISHQRFFVDAIDVEDLPLDPAHGLTLSHSRNHSFSSNSLFSTLLLFSDCLIITKRPRHTVNGRACSGLDDIESLVSLMNSNATSSVTSSPSKLKSRLKKGSLSYRGCVMLDELTGADLGPEGFSLHFETPPATTSDKWANRPLRHYVITPTVGASSAPKAEKDRFLDHLWRIQAQYRGDRTVDASPSTTLLRTDYHQVVGLAGIDLPPNALHTGLQLFFSVSQRREYNEAPAKKRHVLHFDLTGASDQIEFADEGNPQAISRITPCIDGTYFASTEFRIPACSVSTPKGVALPLALIKVLDAVNEVGLFDMPPKIPGYRPGRSKQVIPLRVRSPSLFSSASLHRNGTIGSMFSNSSSSSNPKRSGTIRSAVSVAESKVSSLFSERPSTPSTIARENSSSPVMVSRDTSHEDINGEISRLTWSRADKPVSHSRSSSSSSMQRARQVPSHGSISQILEDEQEDLSGLKRAALGESLSKSQSMDGMQTIKAKNRPGHLDEPERASSVPPSFDAAVLRSPVQHRMQGPRSPASPAPGSPSPRRPLPQIQDVFSDAQTSTPRPASPAISLHNKRPLDSTDRARSTSVSKKPALQQRVVPTTAKPGSRRVSSGRSRRVPILPTDSIKSAESELDDGLSGNIHDDIEKGRNALRQLKTDVASMRQKVLMDLEPNGSPTALPRSPVSRNIKSKLAEGVPPDFEGWMKDCDDRLDTLLAKFIDLQRHAAVKAASTTSQGVQTELLARVPTETRSNPIQRLQVAGLIGERDLLQGQIKALNAEIAAAFETFNDEIEQAYDDAQLSHPEFTQALKADLKQNKAARYAAMVENERLKRELQVAVLKAAQYEEMLRAGGLLS